jgi:hypothetical protein
MTFIKVDDVITSYDVTNPQTIVGNCVLNIPPHDFDLPLHVGYSRHQIP